LYFKIPCLRNALGHRIFGICICTITHYTHSTVAHHEGYLLLWQLFAASGIVSCVFEHKIKRVRT
jgi:hypothetical protein